MKLAMVTDDIGFEQRVRQVCHRTPGLEIVRVSLADLPDDPDFTLQELVAAGGDFILVGPQADLAYVGDLARRCAIDHPEISVVLVEDPKPEVLAAALAAGISDVLDPQASMDEVGVVLRRLVAASEKLQSDLAGPLATESEAPQRSGPLGKVITVASPKGGTGKTTIATNLAVALARRRPNSVALVDLDLLFGDVAFALRLQPEHSIHSLAWHAGDVDGVAARLYLTQHRSGLSVLAAPTDLFEAEQMPSDRVASVVSLLAEEHEFVVVDTAPGLAEVTVAALEATNELFIVGTSELQSFVAIRRFQEGLRAVDALPNSATLVLNRWPGKNGPPSEEVEHAVGLAVRAAIPEAREVSEASFDGSVLVDASARCEAAQVIDRLAASMLDGSPTPTMSTGRRGILRRGR